MNKKKYGAEFIKDRNDRAGGWYRIHDERDNAVGFTYHPENAARIVQALNALFEIQNKEVK